MSQIIVLLHKIRKLLESTPVLDKFEVDESYFGARRVKCKEVVEWQVKHQY